MQPTDKVYYENLNRIFENSPVIPLTSKSKVVIFSDLHMGDGGKTDDFVNNSELFKSALENYYLKNNFRLALNGDIEELQRFKLEKIRSYWVGIYELFEKFRNRTEIYKTIGNHDLSLALDRSGYPIPVYDGIRFKYHNHYLFMIHGHQASSKYSKQNDWVDFSLKYIANPLGIKNFSVAHSSRKKYKIEKRAYRFSNYRKVVTIIGHTHRPLFESFSKAQRMKNKIDQICRDISQNRNQQKNLEASIKVYKRELEKIYEESNSNPVIDSLYNEVFHIPSLFNSGTVIGKRGMTCIEIENGEISLCHWFDGTINKKYLRNTGYDPESLIGTPYHRMVINRENLDYIFTRIALLS